MKIINVSPHARSIKQLLEQASTDNIILRVPDGREFVLAEIDDFNREIDLARQSDRLMKFLDERGKQEQTISLSDARARLASNNGQHLDGCDNDPRHGHRADEAGWLH